MLFTSAAFLIFFSIVSILFFLTPKNLRWLLLLLASFYFYLSWNTEHLVLLLVIIVVNYVLGRLIGLTEDTSKRRWYLILGLIFNLVVLIFFKYYNNSLPILEKLSAITGREGPPEYLRVLFPLGLSFISFKLISYLIDVYRGKQTQETHFGKFALFVSFFPTLIAGPIERAGHLLPQFDRSYKFDYTRLTQGLVLISWGFFKKLVIADRLAVIVNTVYNNPADYSSIPLIIATYLFALQIYCDFSGYTDIAIGVAKILGYDLIENFNQPYFAKSVSEFWRRWHISLSNWFRDYVFFPLERKRKRNDNTRQYVNIMIVFLLTGMWHGSTANFIVWGGLHGLFIILTLLFGIFRTRLFPKTNWDKPSRWKNAFLIFLTFQLVSFAWIFFRSNSLSEALMIVSRIFTDVQFRSGYNLQIGGAYELMIIGISLVILFVVDFLRERGSTMQFLLRLPITIRWFIYYVLIFSILLFGKLGTTEFIYTRF
jgi:D-alanyl-lipoteichoic acid acyltransferase DltB (MBOAT superfamily)